MKKYILVDRQGKILTVQEQAHEYPLAEGWEGDVYTKEVVNTTSNDYLLLSCYYDINLDQPVAYSTSRPSENHYWSENNSWVLDNIGLFKSIRIKRQKKLFSTDWTQFPDSPLSDTKKAEWTTYRQALRDIPETYSDATSLDDIIWPTKPE